MRFSFAVLTLTLVVAGCGSLQTSKPRELIADTLWVRSTTKSDYSGPQGSHFMSPILSDTLVFQGNGVDGMVAFDKKTGAQAWRINIKNGAAGGGQLVGEKLFFGASDGQFYCVDASTGHINWTFPTRSENLATPRVLDGVVYFLSGNNTFYALNAETGKQLWLYTRTQTTGLSLRAGAQPAIDKNVIYIGFRDGFLVALRTKDGSLIWERQLVTSSRFRDVDSSPVLTDDLVFVSTFDGGIYALSRGDGQVMWRQEEGGTGPLLMDRGALIYSTQSGKVVSADSKTGKVTWTYQAKHGVATAPSIMKEYLVFGESMGALQILNVRTGEALYSYATGRGISAPPTLEDSSNEIFVLSNDANLYHLKLSWKRNEYGIY